ncbi:MAG: histidinol-phosphate transaminase [Clostridia bacterium]|nr:histidinol-phosphate transaminase [Clostridia bacterium]
MPETFSIAKVAQPHVRAIQPYEPHLYDDVIKLDANENPYPFPEEVLKEIYETAAREGFPRYPDPYSTELRAQLENYTGVKAKNILAGNGSDELILSLLLAFGGPGSRVIIPVPTFGMYKMASLMTGAEPVEVPLKEDYSLDVQRVKAELAKAGSRVVFLCSPNNPTGNRIPDDEVREICRAAAENAVVILDEAYSEFAGQDSAHLLGEFPNLIILRTFSKAFGLAGLRVGYLLTGDEIIAELLKVKLVYNLNSFSQIAARKVLENREVFRKQLEDILREKQGLRAGLEDIPGVRVFPSEANYFLIRTEKPAEQVHRKLIDQGILVRYLGRGPGLDNCLRISVGTKEENSELLAKLRVIMES